MNIYKNACEKYVPLTKYKPMKREKWMTTEIADLIKTKRKKWFEMSRKERKNKSVRAEYNKLCKKAKKTIKKAVLSYEKDIAKRAKHDLKIIFAYINSKRDMKEAIRILEDESGKRVVEKKEICDVLNRQFSSVFIHEEDGNLPAFQSRTDARLNMESVAAVMTKERIAKCLAGLCPSKSMGADGVHPSVLRYCAEA